MKEVVKMFEEESSRGKGQERETCNAWSKSEAEYYELINPALQVASMHEEMEKLIEVRALKMCSAAEWREQFV